MLYFSFCTSDDASAPPSGFVVTSSDTLSGLLESLGGLSSYLSPSFSQIDFHEFSVGLSHLDSVGITVFPDAILFC